MTDLQMGAVESRFADIIGENEPITASELAKRAAELLDWKKTTSYTVLKRLCDKGIFKNEGGVVTAGNASGRNDGGAALLMMTEEKAKALGYTPIARWVAGADVGVDPKYMGIGPAYSNMKILNKLGMKLSDISVYECNEAFAAQNLSVIRQMETMSGETINMDTWNPNGGAIAFGHPNGASGGRIAMSAIRHMQNTGGQFGLVSSCCGGGIGVSTLYELL
mgnify:CR=1 FL=1